MNIKITTLIENNIDNEKKLNYEHGLSMFIEADDKKILFDTGQTGEFLENAKKLGKDLESLDYLILSHGHYDHTGGLEKFVDNTKIHPALYVGNEFFDPKYKTEKSPEGYIFNGVAFDENYVNEHFDNFKKVSEEIFYLNDDLVLFHHFDKYNDFEKRNPKFRIKKDEKYDLDYFDDEISLGIKTKKGLVVFVGCSHVGILNILNTASKRINLPIYAVIGGTHLVEADKERIQKTAEEFKKLDIKKIAVSHCTGDDGIKMIQSEFMDRFIFNNTGNIIEISDEK